MRRHTPPPFSRLSEISRMLVKQTAGQGLGVENALLAGDLRAGPILRLLGESSEKQGSRRGRRETRSCWVSPASHSSRPRSTLLGGKPRVLPRELPTSLYPWSSERAARSGADDQGAVRFFQPGIAPDQASGGPRRAPVRRQCRSPRRGSKCSTRRMTTWTAMAPGVASRGAIFQLRHALNSRADWFPPEPQKSPGDA